MFSGSFGVRSIVLCKCSGKYIDIYFILKITFFLLPTTLQYAKFEKVGIKMPTWQPWCGVVFIQCPLVTHSFSLCGFGYTHLRKIDIDNLSCSIYDTESVMCDFRARSSESRILMEKLFSFFYAILGLP